MKKLAMYSGLLALGLLAPAAGQAQVIYSTSGALVLGIGDQIGGLFDKLSFGPYASTFVAPQTKILNPVTFAVGYNTNASAPYTASGFVTETITVGGVTQNISLPYTATIDSVALSDSIVLPSTTFSVGGYNFETVALSFLNEPQSPGIYTQYLEANITSAVPEPASWALLISGFGLVGFALRRAAAPSRYRLTAKMRTA